MVTNGLITGSYSGGVSVFVLLDQQHQAVLNCVYNRLQLCMQMTSLHTKKIIVEYHRVLYWDQHILCYTCFP